MAEAYKAAGYATLSMSSVAFTGQNTNLHQGFEELHENGSLPTAGTPLSSKSAREYVDRLVTWVDRHREVPFFVYLQVFDPHSPFEPYGPYNTKCGDPARTEQHRKEKAVVTKLIEDPFMRGRGLPTRNEVIKAGFDPDIYVKQEADWYDGSIRGMDVEMGRLFEQLRRLGLDEKNAGGADKRPRHRVARSRPLLPRPYAVRRADQCPAHHAVARRVCRRLG